MAGLPGTASFNTNNNYLHVQFNTLKWVEVQPHTRRARAWSGPQRQGDAGVCTAWRLAPEGFHPGSERGSPDSIKLLPIGKKVLFCIFKTCLR